MLLGERHQRIGEALLMLLAQQPQVIGQALQLAVAPAVSLYRHGVRLTLEGGYFELIAYLQAVQASGWRLHWQQLDYQVDAGGSGRASIRLELYTLSRQAGWVGV